MPITPTRPNGTASQLLANNGAAGFANVNVSSGLSYNSTTGDLTATGGNNNFKGIFANEAALIAAYPVGQAGWFAILTSTDTNWYWDTGSSAWVDSGEASSVASVNGQTGVVVLDQDDVLNGTTYVQFSAANKTKLTNLVSILDYGAVADGTTDNRLAFSNAAASGLGVYIPAGVYLIKLAGTSDRINLSNNTQFFSEGGVTINFEVTSAVQIDIFLIAAYNRFQNIKFVLTSSTNDIVINLFRLNTASYFSLKNVSYNGGRDMVSENWQPNLMIFTSTGGNTVDKVFIEDCYFTNIHWAWLKTNTATSVQNNFTIQNTTFESIFRPTTLNTPSGLGQNWTFDNCKFLYNYNDNTSLKHLAGTAGGTNFIYSNCYFEGEGSNDLVHFEECDQIKVVNSTFNCIRTSGVQFIHNNVGGSQQPCSDVIVTGNIFLGSADNKNGTSTAIWTLYNNNTDESVNRCIIQGNTVKTFSFGIKTDLDFDNSLATTNSIEACDYAVWSREPRETINNNIIKDCTVGLYSVGIGGMFGKNIFNAMSSILGNATSRTSLEDFAMIADVTTIPTGQTPFEILDLELDTGGQPNGSRLNGVLTAYGSASANERRFNQYSVSWDGATLTSSLIFSWGLGNFTFDGLTVTSDKLVLLLKNNDAGDINIILDISFSGFYMN